MTMKVHSSGDVFEVGCDPVDVTSNHRPDENWKVTDSHGHVHQWYVGRDPVTRYDPSAQHETPTLVWVKDGVGYYEDGEPYDIGHHECRECGEHVEPRFTADVHRVYMPGQRWCKINGRHVSQEEFTRRVEEMRSAR